jgi:hypothetical protein
LRKWFFTGRQFGKFKLFSPQFCQLQEVLIGKTQVDSLNLTGIFGGNANIVVRPAG